ncbi:MAG: hypothetical protein D6744_13695 [Planctomycetota bacterium]|nr:MAG: hypothetical protein D6744_13695 [Planctomycetota bacterium]
MRTLVAVLFASLIASNAAPALAQAIGKPAPEVIYEKGKDKEDDRFLVEKHRGRVLVLYFYRFGNLESIEMLKYMSSMEEKMRPRGVRFIGFCANSKQRFEQETREGETEIPLMRLQYYGNIMKLVQMAYRALSEPYVVIIDANGIIRWRGHPLDGFEERLEWVLKRYPPPGGDPQWLDGRLRLADKLLSQGEIGKAYTAAKMVFDFTDEDQPQHAKAESMMEKLKGEAEKWLKKAIEFEQAGEYDKAAKIVADISVRIEGEDVARDAEQEIGRMNGRLALKEKIREALDVARGSLILEQAAVAEERGDYETAIRLCEKVRDDFEDSDSDIAEQAEKEIERIREDPEAQETLAKVRRTRLADRWYDLGERCEKMELYDDARAWYEKLIKEYPESEAAEKAKTALARLPKPEPKPD